MGIYDFSYASITPEDVRRMRYHDHCRKINTDARRVEFYNGVYHVI